MSNDREQQIRDRAYALWQKEGSPHGRDGEFWERARLMLDAEGQQIATPLSERRPDEAAHDEAVAQTFPASDPTADSQAARPAKRRKK